MQPLPGEAEWDKMFTDLLQGIERHIVEIQHAIDAYTTPEFKSEEANDNPKLQRFQQRFEQLSDKLRMGITNIHQWLQVSMVEEMFGDEI
jgi:hypothetical protein